MFCRYSCTTINFFFFLELYKKRNEAVDDESMDVGGEAASSEAEKRPSSRRLVFVIGGL